MKLVMSTVFVGQLNCFKWLQEHVKIKDFYGTTGNTLQNEIFIALITYYNSCTNSFGGK